jgi:hypothetical protein
LKEVDYGLENTVSNYIDFSSSFNFYFLFI